MEKNVIARGFFPKQSPRLVADRLVSLPIVDVRHFGDSLFDFKWACKKLPKSIPEALKKDLTESKDMKIRHQLIKAKYF